MATRGQVLRRLSEVDPEALALQDIKRLPQGSDLARVLDAIEAGRARPTDFLRAYTALIEKTVASRIDGRITVKPGDSGGSVRPGHAPAPKTWWSCVGDEDGFLLFEAAVDDGDVFSFGWDPALNAIKVDTSAGVDDRVYDLLFVDSPRPWQEGLRSEGRPSPEDQEREVWRRYHTLIDLWTWSPGEEVNIGYSSTYSVAASGPNSWTVTVSIKEREPATFMWDPLARTASAVEAASADSQEGFLSLFASPPKMSD